MCFSATASFVSAGALVSVGAFCVTRSRFLPRQYLSLALIPFLFGVQQFIEGFLWLDFDTGDLEDIRTTALGYMFFSHFFWLFWIPFICYLFESNQARKKLFLLLMGMGGLYGLSMYLPLLFNTDWLVVGQVKHSISYQAVLIYDGYLPRILVRALYALIVIVPLILSGDRRIRIYGYIVATSVFSTVIFYGYAFISVWCFFAAIISIYMVYIVLRESASVKSAGP